ncbi:phosphatidylinositol-specific phospholipase C domain-containing protein [Kitasatospora sp. A2-31]|uniref:phosphatidylinositol-specific phospholipase C domain-containing protein n=1 Tax=Kitasatospora sp. A2-31 TaxID=2916414 RepID=UPI001EEA8717|nr:phosphatidylinositol-specific phospholipase C domain-containing protein [Kitasatospora sp. A2-31]MCG6493897.1 phosphatidylinositol-specific phospholipase C domain-containing protein [Kitasatospora sp. A2-31]
MKTTLRRAGRRLASAALVLATAALGSVASADPAAAMGSSLADSFKSIDSTRHPDWMSLVHGDTWLAAMSIPGTHDTMAVKGGSLVQTQEDHGASGGTLANQLIRGVRALDIRVRVIGGGFTVHHGAFYQDAVFDDVLIRTRDFLKEHSGETILMRLKAECDQSTGSCTDNPSSTTDADRLRIFKQYLDKPEYKGLFYTPSVQQGQKTSVPRLSQVRGKIVLTDFRSPGGADYGFGINDFTKHMEDHFDLPSAGDKWPYVKGNLDRAASDPSGEMFVTYTSASHILDPTPAGFAGGHLGGVKGNIRIEGINPRLMKYLNDNGGRGDHLGVIMMDFPGWALLDDIIYRNPSQIWSAWKGPKGENVCLDDYQGVFKPGAKVTSWACNQGAPQQWTMIGNTVRMGSVSRPGGELCLDITGAGTANGAPVELWTCVPGAPNQQWVLNGKSQLFNPASGRCLDIPGGQTGGRQLDIWDCVDGAKNEIWYHA